MKHIITIFLSLLLGISWVMGQHVTNVRAYQNGETVVITYDLDKKADVYVWMGAGTSKYDARLYAVTGDVGRKVQAGTNRQIIWHPLEEREDFVLHGVQFKVVANPPCFSINKYKKVCFAPGNLQYHTGAKIWRFAEHQYDYIGNSNVEALSVFGTNKDWIDLFGWGTGRTPTNTGTDAKYYQTFKDWGNNAIGNGIDSTWRSLASYEWEYILFERPKAAELFGLGSVNGTKGMILLPDNWVKPRGVTFISSAKSGMKEGTYYGDRYYYDHGKHHFSDNVYSIADWQKMEANGAVFLPAGGYREGMKISDAGVTGCYWSSGCTWVIYNQDISTKKTDSGHALRISAYRVEPLYHTNLQQGCSVRLVSEL